MLEEKSLPVFNTSIFPNWIKDFADGVAEATQTPVDASAIACISLLSYILSKKYEVGVMNSWLEPLNTFSVLVMESASRKSAVFRHITEPLLIYETVQEIELKTKITKQKAWLDSKNRRMYELEKKFATTGKEEFLDEIFQIKEEIERTNILKSPKTITTDITPEKLVDIMCQHNEKIAILSPEGAEAFEMMAGRYSSVGNIDIYLKGHSGDYVSVERVGRESLKLYSPALTIGLFVQMSVIRDIPKKFQERGLTQRFIYSIPKSNVGYREVSPIDLDPHIKEIFNDNIQKLLNLKVDTPIKLTLSPEARELEINDRLEIEKMLRDEDLDDSIKGWIGKLQGQIIRITGILHVVEQLPFIDFDETSISASTYLRAKSLRAYFLAHAMEAHGLMDVKEDIEKALYIIKKIRLRFTGMEKIDYQELWQLVKRKFKRSTTLKNILDILETNNYIRVGSDNRKKVIYINPNIFND